MTPANNYATHALLVTKAVLISYNAQLNVVLEWEKAIYVHMRFQSSSLNCRCPCGFGRVVKRCIHAYVHVDALVHSVTLAMLFSQVTLFWTIVVGGRVFDIAGGPQNM